MRPDFPTDPSDDELARDWLLSEENLVEISRCRGNDKRLSFAIQLCVLRTYGRFLGDDYTAVPVRILNDVGRQLGLPPVLFASPPARKQTDTSHEQRIRTHLGFSTFDDSAREKLETWLRARAAEGILADELVVRAERHLLSCKIVIPARSTVERIVNAIASRSEEAMMKRIHGRLPVTLCASIDALLVVSTGASRSRLEELREAAPAPTPDVINRFLQRADSLRGFDLVKVDLDGLPGVTAGVVAHYAELVRRYDVAHLRRFGPPKDRAMVACFLIEREKSLLDDLVTMHHIYLIDLERKSRNSFKERYYEARRNQRKSAGAVMTIAKALRSADGAATIDAFRKDHAPEDRLGSAIDGYGAFERLEQRGMLDAELRHHSWLKQYLPAFLCLPLEGGTGTESLLGPVTTSV
jgi:hypothetical protein